MGFISQLITRQRIKIGCPENTPKKNQKMWILNMIRICLPVEFGILCISLVEESTDSML